MDPVRRAYDAIIANPNNIDVLLNSTFIIASFVNANETDPIKKQSAMAVLDSSFRLLAPKSGSVSYHNPSEPYDWRNPNSYERQLAALTRSGVKPDLNSMLTAITDDAGVIATASVVKPPAIDPSLIPVLAAISVTAPTPAAAAVPEASAPTPVAATPETNAGVIPLLATISVTAPPTVATPLVVATSAVSASPEESVQSMQEAVQQRQYAKEIEPAPDTFIRIAFKGFEARYLEKGQRVRIIPYETMLGLWGKINASGTMKLPGMLESKAKYKSYSMCMGTNVGTIIGFGYPKPSGNPPRYVPGSDMVQVQCENGVTQWFSAFLLYPSTRGGNRTTRRKSRA